MLLVLINIHITARHCLRPYYWINLYYFVTSVIPENSRFVFHYVEFILYFLWEKKLFVLNVTYGHMGLSEKRCILIFLCLRGEIDLYYNLSTETVIVLQNATFTKITIKKHFKKQFFVFLCLKKKKKYSFYYTHIPWISVFNSCDKPFNRSFI